MSEISKIKTTDGTEHAVKDTTARQQIAGLSIPTQPSDIGAMASNKIVMALDGTTLNITYNA